MRYQVLHSCKPDPTSPEIRSLRNDTASDATEESPYLPRYMCGVDKPGDLSPLFLCQCIRSVQELFTIVYPFLMMRR
jgi:hypothetical protein